jgi:hypothetical protein
VAAVPSPSVEGAAVAGSDSSDRILLIIAGLLVAGLVCFLFFVNPSDPWE